MPIPIHSITATIDRALTAAGLNTRSDSLRSVMQTIRSALGAAGLERDEGDGHSAPGAGAPPGQGDALGTSTLDADTVPMAAPTAHPRGRFLSHIYTSPAGSRGYKLYVPSHYGHQPMPLVVMLHGCTQDPDDFAAGTRMNELAEQHGFLVAYPAQSQNANGSKCWNWFHAQNQTRGSGEPSILVGIVSEIGKSYRLDRRRVYVSGLSAGGAMAVILGATYPDVFAAVGAHSGLPYGAAHDVTTAFAAMRGRGPQAAGVPAAVAKAAQARGMPTIVFHGDRDQTVNPSNADAIIEQAAALFDADVHPPLKRKVIEHTGAYGRRCTSTAYVDDSGTPHLEQWVLHGGAHAWSGGSADGSFADEHGPDASTEMVRFFLTHRLPVARDS